MNRQAELDQLIAGTPASNGVPWSPEAEQAVLGAMLLEHAAATKAVELVTPDGFHRDEHRRLFCAMRALIAQRSVIDPVTLTNELERRGELDQAGGPEYLAELVDAAPTAANVEHHARILREHAERRRVRDLAARAMADAIDPGKSIGETVKRATDALLEAAPATTPGLTILSEAEIGNLPDRVPLVDEFINLGDLGCLYGPSGLGKTFWVLSLAFSIATGRLYLRRRVYGGPVVLVIAEGVGAIKARIRALRLANCYDDAMRLYLVTDAVQLHQPASVAELSRLIETKVEGKPVLVVFDTLARCMIGGDENSVRDVGQAIAGADTIRRHFGCTVLLVHHSQKNGDLERGSSALRAACDTMLFLQADDDRLTLETTKQKDGITGGKIALALHPIGGSCVIVEADSIPRSKSLSPKCQNLLETFGSVAIDGTTSARTWMEASAMPPRTFHRLVATLVKSGYVKQQKRVGYSLTADGEAAIVPSATMCQPTATALRSTATATVHHSIRVAPGMTGTPGGKAA